MYQRGEVMKQHFLFVKIALMVFSLFCLSSLKVHADHKFQGIELREIGSKTRLIMKFEEKVLYQTSELKNPKRIIIHLKDRVETEPDQSFEYSAGSIKSIRFLTLPTKTPSEPGLVILDALVVELRGNPKYEAFDQDNQIYVDVFHVERRFVEETLAESSKESEIESTLKSAETNYKNGYYLLAKADCESVLILDSDNYKAKQFLKKIEKRIEGEKKQAKKLALKLASEQTEKLDLQKEEAVKLAFALEKEKSDQEEAYSIFQQTVSDGKSMYKRKRFEEALDLWEQALDLNPDDRDVPTLLDKVRTKIREEREKRMEEIPFEGDYPEVEKLFEEGQEAFTNLEYANAILIFEKILEIRPQNLEARRYLAKVKRNQRLYIQEGGAPEDVTMEPLSRFEDLGTLTIDDAIQIGVANHLPTKISQEEVILAKMKVGDSRRQLFPKAKLKWKKTEGTTTGEDFEGLEFGAELQQNIWAGGKFWKSYNRARVNLAIARKNYEKTKNEFIFEVRQAFFNLAFAKEKMKNKAELVKKSGELLSIAEKQFSAKALTLAEILDVRAQMEEVKFQTQEIRNDLNLAKLALRQLLSAPSYVKFNIAPIPDPIEFDLDPSKLLDIGYRNRRDYQVKKLLVLFHKYGLEIAKRKNAFNVEISGSFGRRDEIFISESIDLQDEFFVGLKVSKNLGAHVLEYNFVDQDRVPQVGQTTSTEFNSHGVTLKLWEHKDRTSVTGANIAYHKALSDLENSKRKLVHDIHSSIYSVMEAQAKMKNKKSLVALSSEEIRATRAKQQMDQATIVQVMRAEAKMWNSKTGFISSKADYYISIGRLNKHLGVHDYFDSASGVIAYDRANRRSGMQLMVKEKKKKSTWYQLLPIGESVPSYYPDEVVTDILHEKQRKSALERKKLFGLFGKKEDDWSAEYKAYDEKYDFLTPTTGKREWLLFGEKKLDDDFRNFYENRIEYEEAFNTKTLKKKWYQVFFDRKDDLVQVGESEKFRPFSGKHRTFEEDQFKIFLEDKDRILFAEYHVIDNRFETAMIFRTNSEVQYDVGFLENPYRLVVTFKDKVISALPSFRKLEKGVLLSFKAYHIKTVLPSYYRGWNKLLSLILVLDEEHDYSIQSEKDIFKITIRK